MAYLNKNYVFVKQENFEDFLRSTGNPEEVIAKASKFSPDQKLTKEGDTYTYITTTPDGLKETKFKSGVEMDDVLGPARTPIKTTYVVDGNTVTQTVIAPQGKAVFKKEYNGDEMVVTITADNFNGVSKRYYKAA